MSENNFNFFMIALPFLGGFIAFLLGAVFKSKEDLTLIIILGVITGCLLLISLILNELIIKLNNNDK